MKQAEIEFGQFVNGLIEKHGLTYGELVGILSEEVSRTAKYMRRSERHPNDPDAKADEAPDEADVS